MDYALQGVYTVDRMLEGHSAHFEYRQKQFEAIRDSISQAEGSVADFALVMIAAMLPRCDPASLSPADSSTGGVLVLQGYKQFGFHRAHGGTTYKEWAPGAQAAQLIGDFNGWTGTWLERDAFGAWSCHLPDGDHLQLLGRQAEHLMRPSHAECVMQLEPCFGMPM